MRPAPRTDPTVRLSRSGLLSKVRRDWGYGMDLAAHGRPIRRRAASVTRNTRRCVRNVRHGFAFPSTGRLPSTLSATDLSSVLFEASSVLCSRPTPHPRARPSCGCCLHGPVRCVDRTRMRSPRFRTKDVSTCMGSSTARGSSSTSHLRGEDVAFSSTERDRRLGIRPVSQLNTQPAVSPVNASRLPSRTETRASLGAGAVG